MTDEELLKFVEDFKEYLIRQAFYSRAYDYQSKRKILIKECRFSELLPEFISTCRTGDELHDLLRSNYSFSKEVTNYIRNEFDPLLECLENSVLKGESQEKIEILQKDGLSNEVLDAMIVNQGIYSTIFYVENFIRLYISIKHYEKFNNYSLKVFFEKCSNARKRYEDNKNDEREYAWLEKRGVLPCFYLDFSDLKSIIVSNWDIFKEDFPNQAFVNSNFEQFYKIRCKVAHNSYMVQEDEVRILNDDAYILTKQLKKYKTKIRKLEINNLGD